MAPGYPRGQGQSDSGRRVPAARQDLSCG